MYIFKQGPPSINDIMGLVFSLGGDFDGGDEYYEDGDEDYAFTLPGGYAAPAASSIASTAHVGDTKPSLSDLKGEPATSQFGAKALHVGADDSAIAPRDDSCATATSSNAVSIGLIASDDAEVPGVQKVACDGDAASASAGTKRKHRT